MQSCVMKYHQDSWVLQKLVHNAVSMMCGASCGLSSAVVGECNISSCKCVLQMAIV